MVWAMHRGMTGTEPGLESQDRGQSWCGAVGAEHPMCVLGHDKGRTGSATDPFSKKM